MPDTECVALLQWALPRLGLRWRGFRRVRRQVCRRIEARLRELRLPDAQAYRAYLAANRSEWPVLDALCRVTISVFYRDTATFDFLTETVLPELARLVTARRETTLRAWSIGCASGEEPYSLSLAWRLGPASRKSPIALDVLATDVDDAVLRRADRACYPASSLARLPPAWVAQGFDRVADAYCLREPYRRAVRFGRADVRADLPPGRFDLVLCRNLVFTYFDAGLQQETLSRLRTRLHPGGALVIGRREALPADSGLAPWRADLGVYRLASP